MPKLHRIPTPLLNDSKFIADVKAKLNPKLAARDAKDDKKNSALAAALAAFIEFVEKSKAAKDDNKAESAYVDVETSNQAIFMMGIAYREVCREKLDTLKEAKHHDPDLKNTLEQESNRNIAPEQHVVVDHDGNIIIKAGEVNDGVHVVELMLDQIEPGKPMKKLSLGRPPSQGKYYFSSAPGFDTFDADNVSHGIMAKLLENRYALTTEISDKNDRYNTLYTLEPASKKLWNQNAGSDRKDTTDKSAEQQDMLKGKIIDLMKQPYYQDANDSGKRKLITAVIATTVHHHTDYGNENLNSKKIREHLGKTLKNQRGEINILLEEAYQETHSFFSQCWNMIRRTGPFIKEGEFKTRLNQAAYLDSITAAAESIEKDKSIKDRFAIKERYNPQNWSLQSTGAWLNPFINSSDNIPSRTEQRFDHAHKVLSTGIPHAKRLEADLKRAMATYNEEKNANTKAKLINTCDAYVKCINKLQDANAKQYATNKSLHHSVLKARDTAKTLMDNLGGQADEKKSLDTQADVKKDLNNLAFQLMSPQAQKIYEKAKKDSNFAKALKNKNGSNGISGKLARMFKSTETLQQELETATNKFRGKIGELVSSSSQELTLAEQLIIAEKADHEINDSQASNQPAHAQTGQSILSMASSSLQKEIDKLKHALFRHHQEAVDAAKKAVDPDGKADAGPGADAGPAAGADDKASNAAMNASNAAMNAINTLKKQTEDDKAYTEAQNKCNVASNATQEANQAAQRAWNAALGDEKAKEASEKKLEETYNNIFNGVPENIKVEVQKHVQAAEQKDVEDAAHTPSQLMQAAEKLLTAMRNHLLKMVSPKAEAAAPADAKRPATPRSRVVNAGAPVNVAAERKAVVQQGQGADEKADQKRSGEAENGDVSTTVAITAAGADAPKNEQKGAPATTEAKVNAAANRKNATAQRLVAADANLREGADRRTPESRLKR